MSRCLHGFLTAVLGGLVLVGTAMASETQRIGWGDLVPAFEPLANPLQDVDMRVRFDVAFAAQVRADIERGAIRADGPEALNAEAIEQSLRAQGVDVEPMIAAFLNYNTELTSRGRGMVEGLAGRRVTLPGYALPLEVSPDGVREFLLVPYVGACIHVPPPPANQMVYVTAEDEVVVDGLYQPVEVTGLLAIESGSRSLSFVDGSADVATGYTLTDVSVETFDGL